jgi:cell pole-organizing protein PopZ
MTKPQFAQEPSMEDILASIRKMISDDRGAPRPLPDPMTRTPFPEATSPARAEPEATASAARAASSYGSLSEAIKAAAQPADQRRTLEERISDLLDKGSAGPIDPLASFASRSNAPAAPSRPAAPIEPSRGAAPGAAGPTLPFGARAPAPDRAAASVAAPAKAAPAAEPRADAQRVIAMPSRYPAAPAAGPSAPAPNSSALNGTSVAPFGSRVGVAGTQPAKEAAPQTATRPETPAAEPPAPADVVKAAISEQPTLTPAGAPSEALVDAMVELVTKEPSSLSVFTSGMAFIKGVSDKGIGVEKSVAAHKKGESTLPAPEADDSVPELDGAAAELLRPMLRQWLAENMPRIVEAALRSELTRGGKGPGKA